MAFTPQTINNDIIEDINLLLLDGNFISLESTIAQRLLANARKLMPRDPSSANIALAAIHSLANVRDKVIYHVNNANKLPCDSVVNLYYNSAVALSNSGFYTLSQNYYLKIQAHEGLIQTDMVDGGFNTLAFCAMNDLLGKFQLLKVQMTDYTKDAIEFSAQARAVLDKHRVTDATVAAYADIFGDLLSENNLMLKTKWPEITIGDASIGWYPETLFITFKVGTDDATAAQLYKEGTKRLIKKFKKIPDAIHFSVEAA